MNVNETIAKIDAMAATHDDDAIEQALIDAVEQYTEEEPNNSIGQSVLLNELGRFYQTRGKLEQGEESYLRAKAALETPHEYVRTIANLSCRACDPVNEVVMGDETGSVNYGTVLSNLGEIRRLQQRFDDALATFDESIEVFRNIKGDVPAYPHANAYSNKGLTYLDMRDTDKAKEQLRTAVDLLKEEGQNKNALGATLSNYAYAYAISDENAEAIELLEEARSCFEEAGNQPMIHNCNVIINHLS